MSCLICSGQNLQISPEGYALAQAYHDAGHPPARPSGFAQLDDRGVPTSVVPAVDPSWSTPKMNAAKRLALALAHARLTKRRKPVTEPNVPTQGWLR